MDSNDAPIFSAASSSAHQIYTLLKCIGFSPKASVQIMPQGIRFSAEEGRVMQGLAILDKKIFTNYILNVPENTDAPDEDAEDPDLLSYPKFTVSLSALIETLQIFTINDSFQSPNQMTNPASTQGLNAFSTPALFPNRSCTISYMSRGSPLCVTLSEAGITTTCELSTYENDDADSDASPGDFDIPLQSDATVFRIIMRSTWLHNAITELSSTSPTVLSLSASAKKAPFFALSGSGGPFSESTVEFAIDKDSERGDEPEFKSFNEDGTSRQPRRGKLAPSVTESFLVNPPQSKERVKQRYRFELMRKALQAMAVSSKVSIRGDAQGVLCLQFLVGHGGNTNSGQPVGQNQTAGRNMTDDHSFVDFRFVPLVEDDSDNGESDV